MRELKDLIKSRRLEIGKTLEQIGEEIGVAKATVQRWESGEIKDMRQGKLVALAKALEVSPAYLMGWEEQEAAAMIDDRINEEMENDPLFAEYVKSFYALPENKRPMVAAMVRLYLEQAEQENRQK